MLHVSLPSPVCNISKTQIKHVPALCRAPNTKGVSVDRNCEHMNITACNLKQSTPKTNQTYRWGCGLLYIQVKYCILHRLWLAGGNPVFSGDVLLIPVGSCRWLDTCMTPQFFISIAWLRELNLTVSLSGEYYNMVFDKIQ